MHRERRTLHSTMFPINRQDARKVVKFFITLHSTMFPINHWGEAH